jgi:hypothetical protein
MQNSSFLRKRNAKPIERCNRKSTRTDIRLRKMIFDSCTPFFNRRFIACTAVFPAEKTEACFTRLIQIFHVPILANLLSLEPDLAIIG